MKTSDFYYDLPKELIAQDPLEDRSSSRLLHLSMQDGSFEHRHFTDILDYLHKGDCLVINDTKVIPARLYGHKEETPFSLWAPAPLVPCWVFRCPGFGTSSERQ